MSNREDEPTPAQVRQAITTWGVDTAKAQAAAVEKAQHVSLRWYVVSVTVAALVSALLSAGITIGLQSFWVPDKSSLTGFELTLPAGGGPLACERDEQSPDDRPRFVCWRVLR